MSLVWTPLRLLWLALAIPVRNTLADLSDAPAGAQKKSGKTETPKAGAKPQANVVHACFRGAGACCSARGRRTQAECCRRALASCKPEAASYLLLQTWPAALGNIIIALHDVVLLAKNLNRVVVMPPVLGDPASVDLEVLSFQMEVDILVVSQLHFGTVCAQDRSWKKVLDLVVGQGTESFVYEVPGFSRNGPYRDNRQGIRQAELMLPHQLIEELSFAEPDMYAYVQMGSGSLTQAGRWWSLQFPHDVEPYWWEMPYGKNRCDREVPPRFVELPLLRRSDELLSEEVRKAQQTTQHRCLAQRFSDPTGYPAQTQCLVIATMFESVHRGHHSQDHFQFYLSLQFSASVRDASRAFLRQKLKGRPFVAVQIRTVFLDSNGGSEVVLKPVRDAFAELRRRNAVAEANGKASVIIRDAFIPTDAPSSPVVQSVKQALLEMLPSGGQVFTSADTATFSSNALNHHVALDVDLCMNAAAFVGCGHSTLARAIAIKKQAVWLNSTRARATAQASQLGSPEEELPIVFHWGSYLDFMDDSTFPLLPTLPTSVRVARFWLRARELFGEARALALASAPRGLTNDSTPIWSLHRSCLVEEQLESSARDLEEIVLRWPYDLDGGAKLGLERLWSMSVWACDLVGIVAAFAWLDRGLEHAVGFPTWDPHRRHLEQVYFMQRLWQRMSTIGLAGWHSLTHPAIRTSFGILLDRRAGLKTWCNSSSVGFSWIEGGDRIIRMNPGPGGCLLSTREDATLGKGSIFLDHPSPETSFLCPSYAPGMAANNSVFPPPLAVRSLPNCDSASVMQWIAELEGLSHRYRELAAEAPARVGLTKVETVKALQEVGCNKSMKRTWQDHLDVFKPRLAGLPPQFCPSVCSGTDPGRVKVTLVRNPYTRIVSWFSNYLHDNLVGGERTIQHHMMPVASWDDFPEWLAGLEKWMRSTAKLVCVNDVDLFPRAKAMLWQLLPQTALMEGRTVCESILNWYYAGIDAFEQSILHTVESYFVLHLETADSGVERLQAHLCKRDMLEEDEFGACQSLPKLQHRNTVVGSTGFRLDITPEWSSIWLNTSVVELVDTLYRRDFSELGYRRDPSITKADELLHGNLGNS